MALMAEYNYEFQKCTKHINENGPSPHRFAAVQALGKYGRTGAAQLQEAEAGSACLCKTMHSAEELLVRPSQF